MCEVYMAAYHLYSQQHNGPVKDEWRQMGLRPVSLCSVCFQGVWQRNVCVFVCVCVCVWASERARRGQRHSQTQHKRMRLYTHTNCVLWKCQQRQCCCVWWILTNGFIVSVCVWFVFMCGNVLLCSNLFNCNFPLCVPAPNLLHPLFLHFSSSTPHTHTHTLTVLGFQIDEFVSKLCVFEKVPSHL